MSLEEQRDLLLAALERLSFAAMCRDNTMGDPCRLLEVKAELAAANQQAMAAIASAKGENVIATIKCASNCGTDVPVMAKDEGEDHICDGCAKGGAE